MTASLDYDHHAARVAAPKPAPPDRPAPRLPHVGQLVVSPTGTGLAPGAGGTQPEINIDTDGYRRVFATVADIRDAPEAAAEAITELAAALDRANVVLKHLASSLAAAESDLRIARTARTEYRTQLHAVQVERDELRTIVESEHIRAAEDARHARLADQIRAHRTPA